jgi:hypothetical protein
MSSWWTALARSNPSENEVRCSDASDLAGSCGGVCVGVRASRDQARFSSTTRRHDLDFGHAWHSHGNRHHGASVFRESNERADSAGRHAHVAVAGAGVSRLGRPRAEGVQRPRFRFSDDRYDFGPGGRLFVGPRSGECDRLSNPSAFKIESGFQYSPGPCDPGGPPSTQAMPNGNVSTSQALGSKTIQGISACGRGSTIASKNGGTTAFENWFSQTDVGGALLIKVTDDQGGTNVTQLTDMMFSEPNANLFLPPSGYRVVDQAAAFTITAPAPPTNFPSARSMTTIALTGMPWSGELMSGGTVLTRQYRDSMGRTRREQVFGAASRVEIFDPVGGFTYMLDTNAKTALRRAVSAQCSPASEATPPLIASGTQILKGGATAVTQSLGTKTISGVVAYGTRTTITYPPGTIGGNDKTTSSVNEAWFAPQLGASLMNSTSGGLVPDASTAVTNLTYSEPDPSLFQVPAGYRIVDEK